ncbi:MAG: MFS transporter [Gemmataceae bacterium]
MSTSESSSQPTNVRWLVFTLACLSSWFLYLHRYTFNVIRPELQSEYGFDNQQVDQIFTAFNLSYSIGQIPSGMFCDAFGTHFFLAAIIVVWSVALPLFAVVHTVWAMSSVRFLFGAAQAGCYPALGQVTRTWFPRNSRTRVQGWVASFFGRAGGAMASIIMASFLMATLGLSWRWALVVMAAAGVLFGIAFFVWFRDSPEIDPRVNEAERELIQEGEETGQGGPAVLSFRRAFMKRSFNILVVQQFLNAGADIPYTYILGSYFLALGSTTAEMGWLVSLPLMGGALGGTVGGYCNDYLIRRTGSRRWGRSLVGLSGKLISAAVLLAAIAQTDAFLAGIGLFFVKFFTDWSQPTVWGACTDMGGRYSGTVFSINNTSGNVGALVMPLLFGPLLDYYATKHTLLGMQLSFTDFTSMWLVVAAMYVLSGLSWLLIDCTERLDQ